MSKRIIPNLDLNEMTVSLGENVKSFSGKTVLLLGGSGFLGKLFCDFFLHLNEEVLEKPVKIISIDNFYGVERPKLFEDVNLKYIERDLCLPLDIELLRIDADYVLNCAGRASPKSYSEFPLQTIKISVDGVLTALNYAYAKKAKIINFSSSEVLCFPNQIPTPENENVSITTMDKRAPYHTFKAGVETISWMYKEWDNVDVKVIRLFNVIGFNSVNDFRVIPSFMNKIIAGQPIEIYGDGEQSRTFSYFSDVLVGCLLVLLHGKELMYHLGCPENEITMKELAYKVANLANRPDLVRFVAKPDNYINEPQRRCPDITKAKKELGYNPKVSLDEMLRRIYAFYCQHHGIKT